MTQKTISLNKALDLFDHLKSLNGRQVSVEHDNRKTLIFEPYSFDASTCWNIAKNIGIFKRHVEDYAEARMLLVKSIAGAGGKIDPADEEKRKKLEEGLEALLKKDVSTKGIVDIKLSGLNLDKNLIQPGTLAALVDLIVE